MLTPHRDSTSTFRQGAVVVVDDDAAMCDLLSDALSAKGHAVRCFSEPEPALAHIERRACDAVVTDLELGSTTGLDLCSAIVARRSDLPVIVVTAFGSMDAVIAAIRAGAYDFLSKPVELGALELAVSRAVEHHRLQREVRQLRDAAAQRSTNCDDIIGKSSAMRSMGELIRRLDDSSVSVLVTGESGTGKELVAKALHHGSGYGDGPFVPINCAAVPATLLESTLFGHVRGAFTDAKVARDGLFVKADGGTLFLDEIGEMPLEMQAKLLRVLQDHVVRPVGGAEEVAFDCRIVAATNKDLEEEVAEGRFRDDLYYRVKVVGITVPPLRDRGQDVLMLAQHFLEAASARAQRDVTGISAEVARELLDYDWPGNVRELQNVVERAVALSMNDHITIDDLPRTIVERVQTTPTIDSPVDIDAMLTIEELERRHIRRVLAATKGNKTRAASLLGIDRRTLYRKLERFTVSPPQEARA